jgi:hypothetical protein
MTSNDIRCTDEQAVGRGSWRQAYRGYLQGISPINPTALPTAIVRTAFSHAFKSGATYIRYVCKQIKVAYGVDINSILPGLVTILPGLVGFRVCAITAIQCPKAHTDSKS